MNLETAFEMNREPREPRENRELERDGRQTDCFTRRVKKAFFESPPPFAYFVCFAVSSTYFRVKSIFPAAVLVVVMLVAAWSGNAASIETGLRTEEASRVVKGRDHWSFKPLTHPSLPDTRDKTWARNGIDRFILSRLEREGLRPSPETGRRARIARASTARRRVPTAR